MTPRRLILHNGCIRTCDDAGTVVQAIALQDGRIAAVGDDGSILKLRRDDTQVIDVGGRTVIPGLTDGHAHMDREGLRRHLPSLAAASSIDDILDIIALQVKSVPPGTWIVTQPIGKPPEYQDAQRTLKEQRYPDRHDLDRVSPLHPVYIRPIWGYWR